MSVSADTTRLAIIRESTSGVTPANPAFQVLRITSESLNFTPETQNSAELNGSRQLTDVIVSGGASGGDCAFEVSSNLGFELLLESVLGSVWASDRLVVGELLYTHSIEKRWTIDAANLDPMAQYDFHRMVRALADAMSLTFTPGGPANGSVTFIGGTYTQDDQALAGATYASAGDLPVFVGSGVLPIAFTLGGVTYDAWCLNNLVLNLRNNGRAIACLGHESADEVVLGRFECEISATIYINNETKKLMQAFLDNEEMIFAFSAQDSLGNSYSFSFPRARVSAATQVTPGTGQDVVMTVTMQALVDRIATPDVDTCIVIDRVHVSPSWPDNAPAPLTTGPLEAEALTA